MFLNPAYITRYRSAGPPPVIGDLRYRAQVRASFSVGPVIIGNGTFPDTILNWNQTDIDDGWGWTPTTAFTVPSNVRVAVVTTAVYFDFTTPESDVILRVFKNGNVVTSRVADNQFRMHNYDRSVFEVFDGDTIEVYVALGASRTLTATESYVSITGYGP